MKATVKNLGPVIGAEIQPGPGVLTLRINMEGAEDLQLRMGDKESVELFIQALTMGVRAAWPVGEPS